MAAADDIPAVPLGELPRLASVIRGRFATGTCCRWRRRSGRRRRRTSSAFCLQTFVRFCHNHGLLALADRPQWRTVAGGAANLRRADRPSAAGRPSRHASDARAALAARCRGHGARRRRALRQVVLACHSDQARALLADASPLEAANCSREVRYQSNRVVLHTDIALLPRARRAWSAWNYLACDDPDGIAAGRGQLSHQPAAAVAVASRR